MYSIRRFSQEDKQKQYSGLTKDEKDYIAELKLQGRQAKSETKFMSPFLGGTLGATAGGVIGDSIGGTKGSIIGGVVGGTAGALGGKALTKKWQDKLDKLTDKRIKEFESLPKDEKIAAINRLKRPTSLVII